MSGYNHITLVGNLVKDPVFKKVGKKSKADFVLSVERYQGQGKEPLYDYFNIVCWGKLAEIAGEFLKAGKKVLIDGRIQVTCKTVDLKRNWLTEVVVENLKFLSSPVKEVQA
jgi:single-strand DNA-binding protein